jgi:FemAB-related protein (PEP-CTERM system-associated)
MALPLPSIADDLWKALDRKVRNQVRKAQKEQLTTEAGGADLVEDFYVVFASNMRDLGTPVYPKRLFTAVFEQFPTRARIFLVRHEGRPVAAAVSIRFRDTVLVPWASSLRAYRQRCPNMLLYWTMIEGDITDDIRVFDFGRSSPDGVTFQFKQQWGAIPQPQFWEYIQRPGRPIPDHGPSNGRFDTAIEVWKRLPLWLANAVGPHIVRHVP